MNRWTLTARGRTKAARKRKSSKKHASSARKLESSEKNGRQDAHVHVQRAPATKTQRKRAPATKTQKKNGASSARLPCSPMQKPSNCKKKVLQGGVEPVPSQHNCPGRVALANQPSRCLCYYAPVPVFIRGKHGKITPNKSLFGKRNSVLNDL